MRYAIEVLVSDNGRCKVWRTVYAATKTFTRDEAVTEASKIARIRDDLIIGTGRIRIRRVNKP